MKSTCVLVLMMAMAICHAQTDSFENAGVRVAMKIYEDCSKEDGFSPCLKKKAITFLDRLGRMDKLQLTEGITVVRGESVPNDSVGTVLTEDQLDKTLPRSSDARDEALNTMLMDKVTKFVNSRSLEITMPKFTASDLGIEEGSIR